MKIALIGYGKMGKAIEEIAISRGHEVILKCTSQNTIGEADFSLVDVAIEFTKPELAVKHIHFCLDKNIPLVVGTTGWNKELDSIKEKTKSVNGSLLHASNFSVGVNIFFELNKKLAELMSGNTDYSASIEEIHHVQKLDAPSGTAITLAEGLIDNNSNYTSWKLADSSSENQNQLPIIAQRLPEVPGTHTIHYTSEIDSISITHEAHNRKGFALGAVIAAEWIKNKTGVFTMKDVLNF
jgi:4-hydroxy-tetrahydrodipicolinate reductase